MLERVLQIDVFRAYGGRCSTSLRYNILTRTWHVNIGLLYGAVFPVVSVRFVAVNRNAPHRTMFSFSTTAPHV